MADTTGRIPLWIIGTVTGIPVCTNGTLHNL